MTEAAPDSPDSEAYGPWAALLLAAWPHRPFYRALLRRWTGFGVLWLHLLVGLGWIPVSVVKILEIRAVSAAIDTGLEGFPKVMLWEGQARVSGKQPWEMRGPEGELWFVVDTRSAPRDLEGQETPALLTRDALLVSDRSLSLELLPDLLLDEELLRKLMADLSRWVQILYYPFALAADVTWRGALGLIFAAFALWRAKSRGLPLSPPGACRLGMVANTGPFWVEMALLMVGVQLPGMGVLAVLWGLGLVKWVVDGEEVAAPPAQG